MNAILHIDVSKRGGIFVAVHFFRYVKVEKGRRLLQAEVEEEEETRNTKRRGRRSPLVVVACCCCCCCSQTARARARIKIRIDFDLVPQKEESLFDAR